MDHQYIYQKPNYQQKKAVKFSLPKETIVKLHSIKVLSGETISDFITKAVEERITKLYG